METMKTVSPAKQDFVNKTNQEIMMFENLLKALKMSEPVIREFNLKIANARLATAIKKVVSGELTVNYTVKTDYSQIEIADYRNRTYKNRRDEQEILRENDISFIVKVFTRENRIDADGTLKELRNAANYLESQIKDCQDAIDTYDAEVEEWLSIKKLVSEYESKFSSRLRSEIIMQRRYSL